MDQDAPEEPAAAAQPDEAVSDTPSTELKEEVREPTARRAGTDRMLWIGAGVAVLAHVVPFIYLGEPDPLGEGALTEAIAVELVDKAVLEGKDQTPQAKPAHAGPPPQPAPQAEAPPGPQQPPQRAVPPSPPPSPPQAAVPPPPEQPEAKPEEKPQDKSPAVFEGPAPDVPEAAKAERKKETPVKAKPVAKQQPQAKPRPPQPPRPPPQQAATPRAPAAQPSAKASPPRAASNPALARSGKVTQFAKEVVAALAKVKPDAPIVNGEPGPKGKVTVTVVVNFGGGVRTAKVTGSSGNADLDKLALEAAKKAALPVPPPDVTTDDLFYDVEYDFK